MLNNRQEGSGRIRGKSMVTPVHRFQSVECSRPRQLALNQTHRPAQSCHATNNIYHTQANGQSSHTSEAEREHDSIPVEIIVPAGGQQLLPAYLKWGIWASLALGAFFLVSHYYLQQKRSAPEVFVFYTVLAASLFMFIIIALCRNLRNNCCPVTTRERALIRVTNVIQPPAEEPEVVVTEQGPPPPYHIAIMLPERTQEEEAPPPEYDKVVITY